MDVRGIIQYYQQHYRLIFILLLLKTDIIVFSNYKIMILIVKNALYIESHYRKKKTQSCALIFMHRAKTKMNYKFF